jgi:hypothetical protein
MWTHPGAFLRAKQRPFWMRMAQSASVTLLSTTLSVGAKVAVRRLATGSAAAAKGDRANGPANVAGGASSALTPSDRGSTLSDET